MNGRFLADGRGQRLKPDAVAGLDACVRRWKKQDGQAMAADRTCIPDSRTAESWKLEAGSYTGPCPRPVPTRILLGVALMSGSLLMTELSLTRIFSVTMYYHFAFMAISIALFGLSASGVYVFLMRDRWRDVPTERLLAVHSLAFALVTVVALAVLVELRVGLSYTPSNIALMSVDVLARRRCRSSPAAPRSRSRSRA